MVRDRWGTGVRAVLSVVAAAMAALVLQGCTTEPAGPTVKSGPSSDPSSGGASASPSTSGRSGRVEETFLERPPVSSCGEVQLSNGSSNQPNLAAKVKCLQDSDDSLGAELLVVARTVEGDAIRIYYRKEPDTPGYTVFTDSTSDGMGMQGWRRHTCDLLILRNGSVECAQGASE